MAEEVISEILWTNSAKHTFATIIEYLHKEWTEREVEKFISSTVKLLSSLKRHPEMCRPSTKRRNVRIGIINKHTQLVYHYKPKKRQIEVLLFWNSKRDPAKFKY